MRGFPEDLDSLIQHLEDSGWTIHGVQSICNGSIYTKMKKGSDVIRIEFEYSTDGEIE